MRRVVPANGRITTTVVYGPDPWSIQAASLSIATGSYSPMSAGAPPRDFAGDRGYGVNRWAGASPLPLQHFRGLTAPTTRPASQRLGAGAGVSGQPGLPSTGDLTGALGWMAGLPGPGMGLGA